MLRLLPLHELAGAAAGGLRPHAAQPPQVAASRAEGATDVTEDAAGEGAGQDGAGRDAASEDVAAGLPARLLTFMRRDGMGGADASERGHASKGGGAADGRATTEGDGADPSPVDPPRAASPIGGSAPEGSGPAASAPAPTGSGASTTAPAAPVASDPPATAAPVPETDAFGSTVRDGELPAVFQNMSLDADALHLGAPMSNGADAPPDEALPPLLEPPAPAEPGEGLE